MTGTDLVPHIYTKQFIYTQLNKQLKCCSKPRSKAKSGLILSSERNWYVKFGFTLPNLTNICLFKSTNAKMNPLCKSDGLTINWVQSKRSCGRNFGQGFHKYQTNRWNGCDVILPLLNVLRYANRTIHEMGVWFEYAKIQG